MYNTGYFFFFRRVVVEISVDDILRTHMNDACRVHVLVFVENDMELRTVPLVNQSYSRYVPIN